MVWDALIFGLLTSSRENLGTSVGGGLVTATLKRTHIDTFTICWGSLLFAYS